MTRRIMRWVAMALVCLLIPTLALAEEGFEIPEGLEMAEAIRGLQTYPEGSAEEQASCVFRYEYPQFAANGAAAEAINAYYQLACNELKSAIQGMEEALEPTEPDAPASYVEIGYQVAANTEAYLSVILTDKRFFGYVESECISANVFALAGEQAGQPLTLSQVMEREGTSGLGADAAAKLINGLVWKIIAEQQATHQRDYLDDLTENDLERAFNPETDFYMDMDGNLVFFVQAGLIASEVEGILTYPFAIAELAAEAVQ